MSSSFLPRCILLCYETTIWFSWNLLRFSNDASFHLCLSILSFWSHLPICFSKTFSVKILALSSFNLYHLILRSSLDFFLPLLLLEGEHLGYEICVSWLCTLLGKPYNLGDYLYHPCQKSSQRGCIYYGSNFQKSPNGYLFS